MPTFEGKDTILITGINEIYNWLTNVWTIVDADEDYPKLTLTDSSGEILLNGMIMTRDALGKYSYLYQLAEDAPIGKYQGWILTSNASNPTVTYFSLEVR